ncbi:hypothetical protein [uncultured Gammaproteobacteria bacterium]|nr:hypothetical protein [uncultured Gammaproteobacteria bacterium]
MFIACILLFDFSILLSTTVFSALGTNSLYSENANKPIIKIKISMISRRIVQ